MSNSDFANPDGYVPPQPVLRLWTFAFLLLIGLILLGGFLYLEHASPDAEPVVNQYELNGQVYECTHYSDGGMDCHLEGDPDVGFGRLGGYDG